MSVNIIWEDACTPAFKARHGARIQQYLNDNPSIIRDNNTITFDEAYVL